MNKSEAIDVICDKINTRNTDYLGVDIGLEDVSHIEDDLCMLFSNDGSRAILTCEAKFDNLSCFCWGESIDKHRAWVDQH